MRRPSSSLGKDLRPRVAPVIVATTPVRSTLKALMYGIVSQSASKRRPFMLERIRGTDGYRPAC